MYVRDVTGVTCGGDMNKQRPINLEIRLPCRTGTLAIRGKKRRVEVKLHMNRYGDPKDWKLRSTLRALLPGKEQMRGVRR